MAKAVGARRLHCTSRGAPARLLTVGRPCRRGRCAACALARKLSLSLSWPLLLRLSVKGAALSRRCLKHPSIRRRLPSRCSPHHRYRSSAVDMNPPSQDPKAAPAPKSGSAFSTDARDVKKKVDALCALCTCSARLIRWPGRGGEGGHGGRLTDWQDLADGQVRRGQVRRGLHRNPWYAAFLFRHMLTSMRRQLHGEEHFDQGFRDYVQHMGPWRYCARIGIQ